MTKDKFLKNVFQWGALTAIAVLAMPEFSWAQTINEVITDFQGSEMNAFPNLLSAGAYIGGAVLGVSGALKLKAHAEAPASEKMAPGIARLVAGGAIAAAPAILNTLQESTHLGTTRATFLDWNPGF
jgi:hypothetical protein